MSLNGGIAIIDHYSPNKEPMKWETEVNRLVKKWYGEERRAGNSTFSQPKESYEEVVSNSKFDLEVKYLPKYEHTWTVESIIGNLYSTSYGSRRFLGDNHAALFERELEDVLLSLDSCGVFKEEIQLSVIFAIKKK